jgi:hypothetical protein
LKWYFAHASVGENILEGLAELHKADPNTYPIRAIPTEGNCPTTTEPGVIYEHNRGNPSWRAKFDGFHSAVSKEWHSPLVNVAVNKLCYIDQHASLRYYLNSMTSLEAACPQTVLVFTTIPLTVAEDGDNYLRNAFNTRLREWCRANGRILFDLADLEAHDPDGAACQFNYRGKVCQRLSKHYTVDGGHLENSQGRQLVAKGWYALGLAVAEMTKEK